MAKMNYLAHAQLTHLNDELIAQKQQQLTDYLTKTTLQPATWHYLIPELGEGGACSLFGKLQDTPFSLRDHLAQNAEPSLQVLQSLVHYVQMHTAIDWCGIYQKRPINGQVQLIKLAYFGAPSRPLFPLNKEFAALSNNVQVGLFAKASIINNVEHYIAQGGQYYTCDPKVKAESCLPILSANGEVLGIVDAEAFTLDVFTKELQALLVAVCLVAAQHLPA